MVGPTPRRSAPTWRGPVPHLPHLLRATTRSLLPVRGALANARDAVADDRCAARARRAAALVQAHALGPDAWVPLQGSPAGGARHAVDLYADDAELLTQLTAFVADGLAANQVCLVVATPLHRAGLLHRLSLHGLGDRGDLLVLLDAQETLDRFLRDDWPDPALFDAVVGELVRRRSGGSAVRAIGEMVGLLQVAGRTGAARQLEKLWAALQVEVAFDLLCAYPAQAVPDADARDAVLAHHSHVVAALGGPGPGRPGPG